MRLRTDIWISAYLRRCEREGAFAAVLSRGERSAGAVFIEVAHHDGVDLYAPAWSDGERRFECVLRGTALDVSERLESERRFDPDLWVISVEDRAGRVLLEHDERV